MQNDHHDVDEQTIQQVFKESCCTPPSKKVVTFNTQQNKCYRRRGALWNKHELFYTRKELQEMKNDATIQAQKITDDDSDDYKLFRGYEGITSLEIYKQRSSNRKRSRQIVFEGQNNNATVTAIAESYHEITGPSIAKALEVGQCDEMEATKIRYQDILVDVVSEAKRIRRQRLLVEQQQQKQQQQQEKDMLLIKHFTTTENNANDVYLKSHDSTTVSTPSTASSSSSAVSNCDDHLPTIKTLSSSYHTYATEISPSDEFQFITNPPANNEKGTHCKKKLSSRMVAKSFFGKLLKRSTTTTTIITSSTITSKRK
jgi:hypothetical protein